MDDKHDPNASVPIGTFTATTEDGQFEIPIEIVDDDAVEPSTLAIQGSAAATRGFDDHTPAEVPRRKRVQTLMGVAMPGAAPASPPNVSVARDPKRASRREIESAVDGALDDEQPTSVYGAKRDSGGLRALESMLEAQMIEVPRASPSGEIVGVGRATDTGTYEIDVRDPATERRPVPVLAPAQFVEARARETRDHVAPQPTAAAPLPPSAAPRASGASERSESVRPASVESRPSPASSRASGRPERERKPAPISSLAPAEIRRTHEGGARESSIVGYGLVAAMVLLGIGGWWLTAGGYQRGSYESASQPATAPRSEKPVAAANPVAAPKIAEMANAAPVAAPASEAPAALEPPKPTPPPVVAKAPAKPRVAAKAVRAKAPARAAPAPAPAPSPAQAEADGIAATPSRAQVLNGLDSVRSRVQACADGRSGIAEVDVTIAANGVVTNALVGGDFGGTAEGSCIARAVREARFPTFKQDRYRVLFPYVL